MINFILINNYIKIDSYSSERKAEFILSNATDENDYKMACEEVLKLGISPDAIKHHKPHHEVIF